MQDRNIQLSGNGYYVPLSVSRLESLLTLTGDHLVFTDPAIIVVMGGHASVCLHEKWYELNGWEVLAVETGGVLTVGNRQALHGIVIEYRSVVLDRKGASVRDQSLQITHVRCSQQLILTAGRMLDSWHKRDQDPITAHRLFLDLLEILFSEQRQKRDLGTPWIASTLDFIHQHYKKDVSRQQLANYAKVSPEHFSRTFHKSVGFSFNSYVNMLRIREAQCRLLMGEVTYLQDLALELGYRDSYYLSKRFKQVVGSAPKIYIEREKTIVSSNFNYTLMLLSLQVRPLLGAYPDWIVDHVPAGEDRELHWKEKRGEYERLEVLKPDVIIGYDILATDRRLAQIAPVIALPFKELSWREQFRLVAKVAGRQERAREVLAEIDDRLSEANQSLDATFGGRGSLIVVEIYPDHAYIFAPSFGRGAQFLYADLGFVLPERLVAEGINEKGYVQVELALLPAYECDYLLVICPQESLSIRQLRQSSQWAAHSAVQSGKVYWIEDYGSFYGFDPSSTSKQLDIILDQMLQ